MNSSGASSDCGTSAWKARQLVDRKPGFRRRGVPLVAWTREEKHEFKGPGEEADGVAGVQSADWH